ncbi:hypothetical protein GQ600_5481 [Phytophthora cactorum]|nr:hypothetical protein GQ600_5481 [Phytophthora cactorum]
MPRSQVVGTRSKSVDESWGACQEGGELKIDPCSVCGNRMCAIGVFEGATSALNERYDFYAKTYDFTRTNSTS